MGQSKSKVGFDIKYVGSDMVLYYISGSPACFRAMIALEEKKLTEVVQKHLMFFAGTPGLSIKTFGTRTTKDTGTRSLAVS